MISKANGGKASALNIGIAAARGDVIVCTDADSVFLPDTLEKLVRWFGDASVGAVCGNDAPLATDTPIQKFLAITTHIGTGYVRRGLSELQCLPIISGNLGAFRTDVLREIGGYREIWGEDLELTFRLHEHGKKIVFDPQAKVLAQCPGTLRALWKQRVRWVRSYIRIAFLHRRLFFRPACAPFSLYLPINFVSMTLVPVAQLGLLAFLPIALSAHAFRLTGAAEVALYMGIPFFFAVALFSLGLDRASSDLRYLPYAALVLPLSQFFNLVVVYSWWKEASRAEERWDKIERRPEALGPAPAPRAAARVPEDADA
jgi:cellulose synthase/poly-beta-1,6-N-acetylglucosamine synthase-like glycosyltransferase